MPKPGYTQSPEHKKKRLEQIEGDGNGSYKDGRRSYRRKAGAKDNDGTVVHHKNGDRTNNCASNLERLTDGDRKPGRRTTPAHEKHHGGRHGDSIAIRLAIRNDRKPGGCGKGKVGDGTGRCKAAKLSQVTPFSHRTPAEADAARREKLLIQAGKVAVGVGVTGGLAAIALKGGDHANPYHDPPEVAPTKKVETPVNKPQKPASPEKEHKAPAVSAPQDKGVAAKVKTPSNDAPESKKKQWLRQQLLALPPAGKTTEMPLEGEVIYSHHLLPDEEVTVGKKGGRKKKKETAEDRETKEFESKPGHYHFTKVPGTRFKAKVRPNISRMLGDIEGKLLKDPDEILKKF